MCGNAIISDFIPTPASWRVTAEHLWSGKPKRGKRLMVEVQEEGKADFQGFNNDESEEDEFDTMRFSFGSKSIISRGIRRDLSLNFDVVRSIFLLIFFHYFARSYEMDFIFVNELLRIHDLETRRKTNMIKQSISRLLMNCGNLEA